MALTPPVQFTTSANGTAVNNGAATPNGGAAFLHILAAAATDRYTIVVEGSAGGAFAGEQTTLATFTLDAAVLDSERVDLAEHHPQYTRWKATRSGPAEYRRNRCQFDPLLGKERRQMALSGDHVVVKMDDAGGTLRTFAAGDITSVDLGLSVDQHDVTGFGDAVHSAINGQLQAPVTLKGYLTTTATRARIR